MIFEPSILTVSSSVERRQCVKEAIRASGLPVLEASDRATVLPMLEEQRTCLVVADAKLRDGSWKEVLHDTGSVADSPNLIVVAPAADPDIAAEVQCGGAYGVLREPLRPEEVGRMANKAVAAWTRARQLLPRNTAVANAGGEAILIIESEKEIRELLGLILHPEGYQVLLAADGREGIELFRANNPHVSLVMLDFELPGMNGDRVFDALAAIRPDVKVVVMSGHAEAEMTRAFANRTVTDFLPKPFSGRNLTGVIRSALAA
jgi:DNA-binding NtrC family response regulator